MKYNPQFDKNVVDNVRQLAKENKLDTSHIPDEAIFKIYEECYYDSEVNPSMLHLIRAYETK